MSEVIGFHNPEEPYGFLSNWYHSDFKSDGIDFSSMEQFMMYQKAVLFQDDRIAQQILETEDVAKIKELGRCVSGYDDRLWNGIRQIVVYEGLLAKFSQNAELRQALIATGDAVLAECAVRDQIWGIGLSMTDERKFSPAQWKGKNLLGYALMMVRERMR